MNLFRLNIEILQIFCIIFFLLIYSSCSKKEYTDLPSHIDEKQLANLTDYSSSSIKDPDHVQLERGQVFGDHDEAFLGRIMDITVDESGRVYIASNEQEIKVYKPDGSILTTLGREGEGPSEFRNVTNIQIKNNRLFAHDRTLGRVVIFSLDSFSHDQTISLAENKDDIQILQDGYAGGYHIRSDDKFLMSFSKPNHSEGQDDWDTIENMSHYFFLDENGQIIPGKLFEERSYVEVIIPTGPISIGRPVGFYGRLLTALSDDDHFFVAWTKDFLVKVYNPDGEYLRSFYYPHEEIPLTPESAAEAETPELLLTSMDRMDVPETWPALNSLLLDDEKQLWVSTLVDDMKNYDWWVLNEYGALQAAFTWPRSRNLQEIKNGFAYTLETDEETNLQEVVRYRIHMRDGG